MKTWDVTFGPDGSVVYTDHNDPNNWVSLEFDAGANFTSGPTDSGAGQDRTTTGRLSGTLRLHSSGQNANSYGIGN